MGLFKKNPKKELQKQYERLLGEAQTLQRNGDIPAFAKKSAEAEAVYQKLQSIES